MQLKLDLVTSDGCKAELTQWAWLRAKVAYPPEDDHPSQLMRPMTLRLAAKYLLHHIHVDPVWVHSRVHAVTKFGSLGF